MRSVGKFGALRRIATACPLASGDQLGLVPVPGVNDLYVNQARAQPQAFQIVSRHGEKVIIIRTIAIAVEICGIMAPFPIG